MKATEGLEQIPKKIYGGQISIWILLLNAQEHYFTKEIQIKHN
jgi:hypothetical protein